jgi:hypothetical protein
MKKEIETLNKKYQWHGYQEWYWINNGIRFRGCNKNGKRIGYMEWHNSNWNFTKFYIR